jgi:hypothetical protein
MTSNLVDVIDSIVARTDKPEVSPNNPYLSMNSAFIGYIAGLIDGEGCVFIHRHEHLTRETPRPGYSLMVTIANTKFDLLSHLKLRLGGHIDKTNSRRGNEVDSYRLRFNSDRALWLLEVTYPYLILKSSQARLGMELQRKIRLRRTSKKHGAPLTEAEIDEMDSIKHAFTVLNRRGI